MSTSTVREVVGCKVSSSSDHLPGFIQLVAWPYSPKVPTPPPLLMYASPSLPSVFTSHFDWYSATPSPPNDAGDCDLMSIVML